uniref:Uncharacterized protein n=1 Tax=Caenorhabditis japonica TaxID=281687 RepID=A0A8R1EPF8_CAEJA
MAKNIQKNVVYEALQPMDAERMERMEEGNLRNEEKVNSELPLCENVAPPPYEKLEILTANSQEQEEVSIVFKPNIHV